RARRARAGARRARGGAVGGGRAGAGVGAVEARPLERDADAAVLLAQGPCALGALRQRGVGERLIELEAVPAGGAGVGIGRHEWRLYVAHPGAVSLGTCRRCPGGAGSRSLWRRSSSSSSSGAPSPCSPSRAG